MTVLSAPNSTAKADVPEELVARFEAAGWVRVNKPKPTRKKAAEAETEE